MQPPISPFLDRPCLFAWGMRDLLDEFMRRFAHAEALRLASAS